MRNLNFGGKTYYVYDEDLHEDRTAVLAFTGSLKVQCANNLTRDIQLSNFVSSDDLIILHQGETVGGTSLTRTHDAITFNSEKPPAIVGIPSVSHSDMRLKLDYVSSNTTIPPGLSLTSGYNDLNSNNSADDGEWDGSITLEGTLENVDTNYSNLDGYQDFTLRLKADLDTNCDSQGWTNQINIQRIYCASNAVLSASIFRCQFTYMDPKVYLW